VGAPRFLTGNPTDGAVGEHFFFPNGRLLFDLVDQPLGSLESGRAMRRTAGNRHADFADLHSAYSMDYRAALKGPTGSGLVGQLVEDPLGHFGITLVLQACHGLALAFRSHGPQEKDHGPGVRGSTGLENGFDLDGVIGQTNHGEFLSQGCAGGMAGNIHFCNILAECRGGLF